MWGYLVTIWSDEWEKMRVYFIFVSLIFKLLPLSILHSLSFYLISGYYITPFCFSTYLHENYDSIVLHQTTVFTTKLVQLHRRKEKLEENVYISRGKRFCRKERKVDRCMDHYSISANFTLPCLNFNYYVSVSRFFLVFKHIKISNIVLKSPSWDTFTFIYVREADYFIVFSPPIWANYGI
jgi:hypothetical protein